MNIRILLAGAMLAIGLTAANAEGWVWHGNDTGGIISWSRDAEITSREVAGAYCAGWGKYARITSVHRRYGDYISFNCLWNPNIARYAIPAVPVARAICHRTWDVMDGRRVRVTVCG